METANSIANGIKEKLFGSDRRQLTYKAMDAATLRSRAIAQNLANINTAGYQRKEVSFEEEVQRALKLKVKGSETDEDHKELGKSALIQNLKAEAYDVKDETFPGELNNVDVDLEASKMAENQIMYYYLTKFASFDKYNASIKGNAY